MTIKTSADIRSAFTSFFVERYDHTHVPSGSLVLPNDPTLHFANAGMVPFKDVFTGKESRPYTRATSSQKCIRISGKHNDLENVGRTARHHTFFEMLGNFSFGDYFKREAIEMAWRFYMDVLKLDPERMVFTVFAGEEGYGPADEESAKLWMDVTGCDPERVKRCNAKENFWQMGETGPCGPCTEIHYCLGTDNIDPSTFGEEPTPDGRGWFELWNLVFMQFDKQPDGTLNDLPAPSVDTGAGLERAAVVVQDVLSNYDTDLLRPLVDLASEISGKSYSGTQQDDDVSMRVIADHARLCAFLVSENVFPGKADKEFVVRRVARRAIRHGYRLGINEPFLHRVALRVVELMGDVYPQLQESKDTIADQLQSEEERFRRTLADGLERLRKNELWNDRGGRKELPGTIAFDLHQTYGFPIDLTEVIAEEEGFIVDRDGFESELLEEQERGRAGSLGTKVATSKVHYDLVEELGATRFLGYEREKATTQIRAILKAGERVDSASAGDEIELVTTETPFYAEKGGQVGDRGIVRAGDARFGVADTQTPVDGLVLHRGTLAQGELNVGDSIEMEVDHPLRSATRRNHSATHLLHWALREVIGTTVAQKGSLVGPDRLRFDFSATKPLTADEIEEVEDLVNRAVLENSSITTEEMPIDQAKERGAIGMFGEKYGDEVRVLQIGPSLELCGGTHAFRTGDIGLFTILSDSGIAAGVRRIEAATGLHALQHLRDTRGTLRNLGAILKSQPSDVEDKLKKVLDDTRELRKDHARLQKELASGGGSRDLGSEAREVDGVRVLGATVPSVDGKALREMADQLKDKMAPAVILLGSPSRDGKKAVLVCSVSKEVTSKFKAGDIVKKAAAIVGGGGGGRPDFAQAGGSDPSKLEEAVAHVYEATGA